jgi:hypothetical protein
MCDNICPCGIYRPNCTYHAPTSQSESQTRPKGYRIRAKGWYTGYVWRTGSWYGTLEEAQLRRDGHQKMNDEGKYNGPDAEYGNRKRDMVFEVIPSE